MERGNALLLACLRNDRSDAKIETLGSFQNSDWDLLFTASQRFGTSAFLYHTLKPLFPDVRVPPVFQVRLREIYLNSAARNMWIYQQLLNLVGIFNHENIPVILLKGSHLAELVYGNIALRPMGDLDLLVRHSDLLMASELLAERGYTMSKEDVGCSPEHLPPFSKADSMKIEIHFNIVSSPFSDKFDVGELWQRARNESIQGIGVLTLCPEDLFLHLCVHACVKHGLQNGIMPFVDISQTLDRYREAMNWDDALKRGRQWGVNRCVDLMLTLSEKMLGLSVEGHVIPKIGPDRDGFDIVKTSEEFVLGESASIVPNVARLFGNLTWFEKIRHLMRRISPPPETISVEDGGKINKLSMRMRYFYRIKGLWKRHGKIAWRVLLNDKQLSAEITTENKRNRLQDWLIGT